MTQGPQPFVRRDDERLRVEPPLGTPRWGRPVQHVLQDGDQLLRHFKIARITRKVKRDQLPVRQPAVTVRSGILVGDGIAHIDH